MKRIPVVDLFAGPGGLGEGFAQFRPSRAKYWPFEVALSAEFNPNAWRTLRLRAMYRSVVQAFGIASDEARCYWEYVSTAEEFWQRRGKQDQSLLDMSYPMRELEKHFERASRKSNLVRSVVDKVGPHPLELGSDASDKYVSRRLRTIKRHNPDWILLGGPPCPTYSLAGRSRMIGENEDKYFSDHRHHLYEKYLNAVRNFQPAVFIMENVTGLLSSKDPDNRSQKIVEKIVRRLERPHGKQQLYDLYSFTVGPAVNDRRSFIIRAEEYGIPQARHRVIILGIRRDRRLSMPEPLRPQVYSSPASEPSVELMIGSLPRIRSDVSLKKGDLIDTSDFDGLSWRESIIETVHRLDKLRPIPASVFQQLIKSAKRLDDSLATRSCAVPTETISPADLPVTTDEWFKTPDFGSLLNHQSRSHMPTDLVRYLFASSFAEKEGRSPSLHDLDDAGLLPEHKNVKGNSSKKDFADRFRVQLRDRPSTTIFSHISKDGHYFIHPDPTQCRSFTVREAARLQTFPDDYYFEGPRTDQYHQVGNAVPPLLALQLARIVYSIMR